MEKMMKSRNMTLYIYGAIAVVLAVVWKAGVFVNGELAQLPVQRLQRTQAKPVTVDSKSFYPVWMKQTAAMKADAQAAGPVDDLFKKQEESKPVVEAAPKPQEPDYAAIVKQSAFVEAVSDNGAVINGRFYALGAPIEEMAFMPVGKAPLVPFLRSVRSDEVTIAVGKASVVVRLAPAYN